MTSLKDKTVYVLDAHGILYQVFHALPPMSSPAGEPVGAVYGFARDLMRIIAEHKPDYIFCAFDMRGPTFRHELYAAYKEQREETPLDLRPQIDAAREVLEAFGIPHLGIQGFEADDIFASLSHEVAEKGGKCVIVTSDKDARQLISDSVSLFNLRKNKFYLAPDLMAEWGIRPDQVVDFQALVGDASDNVPGIPGIGPKFAQQLLEKYETLEKTLEHAGEISGEKRKKSLIEGRDIALLSRELVRLKLDIPLGIDWEKSLYGGIDLANSKTLFERFGFRSIIPKLAEMKCDNSVAENVPAAPTVGDAGKDHDEDDFDDMPLFRTGSGKSKGPVIPEAPENTTFRTADSAERFEEFFAELSKQKCFAFDLETVSIDPARFSATQPRYADIVGMSFCWSESEAWYLPFRGPDKVRLLDEKPTLERLRPIFENEHIGKIGQNLKFDMVVLRSAGVNLQGLEFDTMIADYLLHAGFRHRINDIAIRYLGHEMLEITDLIGTGKKQIGMDEVPLELMQKYACEDVWIPWRLRPLLESRLKEQSPELWKLYCELELPLVQVLAEIEFNGIAIDVELLKRLSVRFETTLENLEREIHELAGKPFNIASPKQLQVVLFDELKLPVIRKTQTGASTDAGVLEELAPLHPLPEKIVEYRQASKLKGTYVDALPEMSHPVTHRIHASFNQFVTSTGRLSSSDPNLQNIPVRSKEGREIREAFVPGEGFELLLACDYSQIELRVLAHCSRDEHLCKAFEADEDIHAKVASDVFGVQISEVTSEMRRNAKAVNFGIIYGQTPFGLGKALGIPKEEAAEFIEAYFKRYPQIPVFLDRVIEDALRDGYVETIFGRRREIIGVRDFRKPGKDGSVQLNMAERTAINTVIQGSAADLMKKAMIEVCRNLRTAVKDGELTANMLLQIHDELVFELREKDAESLKKLVLESMSLGQPLGVPLKIDVSLGRNWAEAK